MVLIHFAGVGTKKSQNTQAKTRKGSCKGCWRAWEMWLVSYCEYVNMSLFMFSGCHSYIGCFADDPHNDPNVSGDPYKTLFVAKLVSWIF